MLELERIEFPSKYLTCYESVLMTLLKYQGVNEETLLMGTQAYFVFTSVDFRVSSKFHSVEAEWHQRYGCQINFLAVNDEAALQEGLVSRLDAGVPVCLPVDLYSLPHTLHHQQLHQHHYVNIFGYENGRYYMVCPYYRYQGWVDAALIHDGFFSPVVAAKGAFLITLPPFSLPAVAATYLSPVVEENCRYMLNLAVPDALTDVVGQNLGVAGLQAFAAQFQQLAREPYSGSTHKTIYINLSRQVTAVGHSRYWFHKMIQTYQPDLLSADLQSQFATVIQAWKAIGIRLGMGVHGQRAELIQRVALSLQEMCQHETRLFNTLLGALPNYEQGTL